MKRTYTREQQDRINARKRKRYAVVGRKGKRETPEQQSARKKRMCRRLYGGKWSEKRRAERKREFELRGKQYNPRGTVDEIKKRAAIKQLISTLKAATYGRLIKTLKRKVYCTPIALTAEQIEHRRLRGNADARAKYASDAKYAIYHRMKRSIHKHLRDNTASRNWSKHIGYSMHELHAHIERQFTDGMTWENMGAWHIDHVRPVASFTFASVDDAQFRACYALRNLQPLWALDNMRKQDKHNGVMSRQARPKAFAGPCGGRGIAGAGRRDYRLDNSF